MEPAFNLLLYAVVAIVGLTCYASGLIIYRLSFHPLARFPGSKIAAATKWYECYYDCFKGEGGQYAWRIQDMHRKYGPIVRINPDEIHIMDPDYYETIYAPLPARRDKYEPAANMVGSPLGTFGTIQHNIHRKRRLANSPLFAGKAVNMAQSLIYEHASKLCTSISVAYHNNQVLPIQTHTLAFATDLMTYWILGSSLGCQDDFSVAETWARTTRALPRVTPWGKQFPWIIGFALSLPLSWIQVLFPSLANVVALHKNMHKAAHAHAAKRDQTGVIATKESKKDMPITVFEAIEMSELPDEEKAAPRAAQEAFVLISAGAETSARAITTCLFQLVTHPNDLATLERELFKVMPKPTDRPALKALEEIPFLTAVLKETLRTMQLLTSRLPLRAPEDLVYKEWVIPAKTPVSMTPNEVLTDPSIYPEPREFRPDRWLDESGQLHDEFQRYFPAFGRGTRACQGQNIAWAEMYICVAQLVRRFKFELYDTTRLRDFDITRDCFFGTTTESSKGIRMRVVKEYTE